MPQTTHHRATILDMCSAIAMIAIAMSLARVPEVWACLDARNVGYRCAACLYCGFWLAFLFVAFRVKKSSDRFFGLGWVFASAPVIGMFLPSTHVGSSPDYHSFYCVLMTLASALFFSAGICARLVETRASASGLGAPDRARQRTQYATGDMGYWIWQVRSMDEAITWLKRCPNPMPEDSEVEIRPIFSPEDIDEAIAWELQQLQER